MERRILLALALSFLLITLTRPLWEPQRPAQPPAQGEETRKEPVQSTSTREPSAPPTTNSAPAAPVPPLSESKQAAAEQFVQVETDLYLLKMSNREAVVRSWVLKKYKDSHGKPLEFIDEKKSALFGFPLTVGIDKEEDLTKSLKNALYATDAPAKLELTGNNTQQVTFEYASQNVRVSKQVRFTNGSYVVGISSQVWLNSKP
ncbi:MAG TPA: membrane protein insertase YidC, partial [Terriglobia bacterium]|nr:membrane protein insertase YidC [Terriglobia bacterium]